MSIASALGLQPGDRAPVARLGAFLSTATIAEVLIEGAALSLFLSRAGADQLPLAIAARAVTEVLAALITARLGRGRTATAILASVFALTILVISAAGFAFGDTAFIVIVFLTISTVTRLRIIHFGVLALEELGPAARRALPQVHAAGRLGAAVAGQTLAVAAGYLHGTRLLVLGAIAYVLPLGIAVAWRALGGGIATEKTLPELIDDDAPPSIGSVPPAPSHDAGRRLVLAIAIGAVGIAAGRVALKTQSGAILETAFGEAELTRLLGQYFVVANLAALVVQTVAVGRWLERGWLPWLNMVFALAYLGAQMALAIAPALVVIALAALLVEGELRNTIRTPIANLLYEAIPDEHRARDRTMVIGVVIPATSLLAGLALSSDSAEAALGTVGTAAALVLFFASYAQNAAYRRALGRPGLSSDARRG